MSNETEREAYRRQLYYGVDYDGNYVIGTKKELQKKPLRWYHKPAPDPVIVAEEAAKIAAVSDDWTADVNPESHWCFTLQHTKGPWRIHIDLSNYERYAASGSYPHGPEGSYHTEDSTKVTTARVRGPAALIAAIESRLLPVVKQEWVKVEEAIKKATDDKEAQDRTLRELEQATGTTRSDSFQETIFPRKSYIRRIQVNHNGTLASVEFYTSLPLDIVKKIIELCKEDQAQ